jgi:glycine dehydrogenase
MAERTATPSFLAPSDLFVHRHIGPRDADVGTMLGVCEAPSLDALIDETIPAAIRIAKPLTLGGIEAFGEAGRAFGEHELIGRFRELARQNGARKSYIGLGYHGCIVPPVVQRNVLENPGWYTAYTPYQAEIAQGRLEALLNFQTMVADLTQLSLANASLLDEGTAAAEAMHMAHEIAKGKRSVFFVSDRCHPQTIAVVQTRAEPLGIEVRIGDPNATDLSVEVFGVLVQYPDTEGAVLGWDALADKIHKNGALLVVATDLLALTLLRAPGEFGADIAIGSSQRFGVPMGFGGPHAAFMAARDDYRRQMPGRIIGVSKDSAGNLAYRMALQTREQHIRRERATSNICTAQVLLAIMASMYAVWHGPAGLRQIASRVRGLTLTFRGELEALGYRCPHEHAFDTLLVEVPEHGAAHADATSVFDAAAAAGLDLRKLGARRLTISFDETTTLADVEALLAVFSKGGRFDVRARAALIASTIEFPAPHRRTSSYLEHPVFHRYHAEHEMLRYMRRLEARDLSLTRSMIALGSCTMKLNATSEMVPVTWPELANLHPFTPAAYTSGYQQLFVSLRQWLCDITGFAAVSLQPNAGSQGEYAGLLVIRAYHRARGDTGRNVCLIPVSAHGTNPASAVLAGMQVVVVKCDEHGNVDVDDLRAKAQKHAATLAALMVTYPSTHGVFEDRIREICEIVHAHGGQVYLDGANMNAQVGLCRPGDFGADVCHLNLHKTFCIPHGGGGPGMGPICVAEHLAAHLPGHPLTPREDLGNAIGAVAAAPCGSPLILPISWVYIALMGAEGLTQATKIAILNANYMAARLRKHYPVLYAGRSGRVAHEFILDLRPFKQSAGIEAEDVAKRLMDYGFHAPTMSFPVAGTLMIEPTESESKAELDRFCDALIAIREEIRKVESGEWPRGQNPLEHAPHTAAVVCSDGWDRPYSREQAAFPLPWVGESKFWPAVGRIDNVYGDRNLVCTCPPLDEYEAEPSSRPRRAE